MQYSLKRNLKNQYIPLVNGKFTKLGHNDEWLTVKISPVYPLYSLLADKGYIFVRAQLEKSELCNLSLFLLESWNCSYIEMIKTPENTIFVSKKSERPQQKSPLKMTKNVFYFVLKAFFVLKMFTFFFTTFWSCRKSSLIRKIRLISKFMTSQPGLQTIPIHIWPNISQSKDNQSYNITAWYTYYYPISW